MHNDCPVSENNNDSLYTSSIEWSNHGYKHFPSSKLGVKELVESTKKGPAKYMPNVNVEDLERMVWQKGIPVSNGKTWKVMAFDEVIGASEGKATKYVRVEMSANTIHGHPITVNEYKKLTK